ncbi:aldolase/citrate lyase family protein, partial [Kribbia dieselivorans]|uniref:aldolase/citrate lyase family protein n=1 Tax=Kribbia dieselivorans TaxID=331526 RepID=UPI000AF9323F
MTDTPTPTTAPAATRRPTTAAELKAADTLLFVPGDRPERFAKAVASGADVVILDLEDAVSPESKDTARAAVAEWLAAGNPGIVRINAADSAWHAADVAALAPHAGVIFLPKAESAADVAAVVAA